MRSRATREARRYKVATKSRYKFASMNAASCAFETAPTLVATTWPSLNNTRSWPSRTNALERLRAGLVLHFEMIPDRLPAELRELIERFPPGSLQLEVGVQTFNPTVAAAISRRQDYARLEENFRFLRGQTGVHLHADLIVGLPGETVESFATGFDRLVGLRPQEIQVGMLKRLRGTPISRHDAAWGMVYSPLPPYEILQNKLIDFATMQRLRRFARYWDLIGNSGNFVATTPLVWAGGGSPFAGFLRLSEWLYAREGRLHGILLTRLMEQVFIYLTTLRGLPERVVAETLWRDFQRGERAELPPFLRPHLPPTEVATPAARHGKNRTTLRQSRHRAAAPDTGSGTFLQEAAEQRSE